MQNSFPEDAQGSAFRVCKEIALLFLLFSVTIIFEANLLVAFSDFTEPIGKSHGSVENYDFENIIPTLKCV